MPLSLGWRLGLHMGEERTQCDLIEYFQFSFSMKHSYFCSFFKEFFPCFSWLCQWLCVMGFGSLARPLSCLFLIEFTLPLYFSAPAKRKGAPLILHYYWGLIQSRLYEPHPSRLLRNAWGLLDQESYILMVEQGTHCFRETKKSFKCHAPASDQLPGASPCRCFPVLPPPLARWCSPRSMLRRSSPRDSGSLPPASKRRLSSTSKSLVATIRQRDFVHCYIFILGFQYFRDH